MKVEVTKGFRGAPEGHTNFDYSKGQIVEGIHAKFVLRLGNGEELKQLEVEQEKPKTEKPKKEAKKRNPKPKNKKTPKPDHEG